MGFAQMHPAKPRAWGPRGQSPLGGSSMGGIPLWTEDRKPSFHFLPQFSEDMPAVLTGGWRGLEASRHQEGRTPEEEMVMVAPETSIMET